jgi:subtilase family serine protease
MNRKLLLGLCVALLAAGCLVFLGKTFAQSSAAQSRITQAVDESRLTILRGNTHPFARPEFDRGVAPPDLPEERMLLVLRASPEQEAAAVRFHAELQDKSSPNYHKWITPEEFGQRFGASDADIQTITSWLESHGFTIDDVSKAHNLIEFSGTAGQVSAAFHTDIHSYVVNGEQHWANASDPAIPSALVPAVTGIASLHNFPRRPASHFVGNFRRDNSTGKVQRLKKDFTTGTCNDLQSPPDCFLVGPGDFAAIYNLNPLYLAGTDGTGVAIAIVAQTDINPTDFQNFRSQFNLSAGNLHRIYNGPPPGVVDPGDEGESDLDTQWSSAVARNAIIDLVISGSTNASSGVDLSAEYIVLNANNAAIFPTKPAILSESYGACELQLGQAGNAMFGDPATGLWSLATAENITVVVATGDQGSAGCANPNPNVTTEQPDTIGLNVSGLSSTNFNIAVGGTDFNQMTNATAFWNTSNTTDALSVKQVSAMGYIPETTWNDSCANLIWGQAGFSANPETNCNNTTVSPSFIIPEGGGGGISNCTNPSGNTASTCAGGNPKPAWQVNVTPADNQRDVPDVSLFAGAGLLGSFYVVCQQSQNPGQVPCSLNNVNDFQGFGGTSVSSQTFAGMMALVVQAHGAQGLVNSKLYTIAGGEGATCPSAANPNFNSCIFFDVTVGNIQAPCVLAQAAKCSATTPAAVPVANFKSNSFANWIIPAFLALCASLLPFAIYARRHDWRKAFAFGVLAFALVSAACGGSGGGGGGGGGGGQQLNGILPGYDAKAGYDLATGLGSVNGTKLVNSTAW